MVQNTQEKACTLGSNEANLEWVTILWQKVLYAHVLDPRSMKTH